MHQILNSKHSTATGKWDIHADFRLIESIEELREYAKTCEGLRIAVDTETTGLTYQKDFIVGFSVSKSAMMVYMFLLDIQVRKTEKIQELN